MVCRNIVSLNQHNYDFFNLGSAYFTFFDAGIFKTNEVQGDVTGMYMIDDEGTLQTVDVKVIVINSTITK